MGIHQVFSDDAIEALLAGCPPTQGGHDEDAEATAQTQDLAALAGLIEDMRGLGSRPAPVPSAALATILDEGLPAGLSGGADSEDALEPAATRRRAPRWRRIPAMLGTAAFGWIATLSLAGKAALALTAAGALAAGGAAVDLPAVVSDAFDQQDEAVDEEQDARDEGLADTRTENSSADDDTGLQAPQVERRSDLNPASDASAPGRQQATDRTADTPARVPATVGPGTGEEQRADPGERTPEPQRTRAAAPAPATQGPASPPPAPNDPGPAEDPGRPPEQAPPGPADDGRDNGAPPAQPPAEQPPAAQPPAERPPAQQPSAEQEPINPPADAGPPATPGAQQADPPHAEQDPGPP